MNNKWHTQGAAAACSMPCCTVFTYKTIIEATFLSKIQAKFLEAQYCVIEGLLGRSQNALGRSVLSMLRANLLKETSKLLCNQLWGGRILFPENKISVTYRTYQLCLKVIKKGVNGVLERSFRRNFELFTLFFRKEHSAVAIASDKGELQRY